MQSSSIKIKIVTPIKFELSFGIKSPSTKSDTQILFFSLFEGGNKNKILLPYHNFLVPSRTSNDAKSHFLLEAMRVRAKLREH
jgi:hypothetical protein